MPQPNRKRELEAMLDALDPKGIDDAAEALARILADQERRYAATEAA